jgi:hypothetical protein
MRGKNLSAYGECAESIFSVDGDYVKSGLLPVLKSSPYAWKVFKRIRRMRGKDLCVIGEDPKRLLAYSPNTPRDVKV